MKYYRGASTNEDKGYKTHGSFKHKGQKQGLGGKSMSGGSHKGLKKSKESVKKNYEPVDAKLRKIGASMFGMKKAMNNDAATRSQLNA